MKIKLLVAAFLFIHAGDLSAQSDSFKEIKPRYHIYLTTMQDNVLKGLLVTMNDSSVVVYPGKQKDWNHRKVYKPVQFVYTHIRQIKLKRKNGLLKGMMIGTVPGLSPLLATSREDKAGLMASITPFTFSAAIIGGAIIGGSSGKKYYINGDNAAFNEFLKEIL